MSHPPTSTYPTFTPPTALTDAYNPTRHRIEAALAKLDPDQAALVDWMRRGTGDAVAIAVAGAGKTTSLVTGLAAMLVLDGVLPTSIVAVTFTAKAGAELRTRLAQLIGPLPLGLFLGTSHAWALQCLRQVDPAGWPMDRCLDVSEGLVPKPERVWESIVGWRKDGVLGTGAKSLDVATIDQVRDYMLAVDRLRGRGFRFGAPGSRKAAGLVPLPALYEAWGCYTDAKVTLRAFDFADVLDAHLDLLRADQGAGTSFIAVDENQDNNTVQHEIVDLAGKGGRRLRIGDSRQSIYSFRGASPELFIESQSTANVFPIRNNYRSDPSIVNMGNRVAQGMPEAVRAGGDAVPARSKGASFGMFTLQADPLEDDRDAGIMAQAQEIAQVFRSALAEREYGWEYRDCAVIVRTNAEAGAFEAALHDQGLPVVRLGGQPFWERNDVMSFLAYAVLTAVPAVPPVAEGLTGARGAFDRIVNKPKRMLPKAFTEAVLQREGLSWSAAIQSVIAARDPNLSARQRSAAVELGGFLETIQARSWDVSAGRIQKLLERDIPPSSTESPDEDRASVPRMVAAMARVRYQTGKDRTGLDFAYYAHDSATNAQRATSGEQPNRVVIGTAHAMKGLEYSVVALSVDQFPHPRAVESGDIEEERRLLYVAVTRAKCRLFVTRGRTTEGPFDAALGFR